MTYFVNGFREGKSYFYSFGFTERELAMLDNGEVVEKNGNRFWIAQ